MDPKQAGQPLDPKLQEAYNKVMGIPTTGTPTPPAQNPAPTTTITTPNVTVSATQVPTTPPPAPTEPPVMTSTPVMPEPITPPAQNPSVQTVQATIPVSGATVHVGATVEPTTHGFVAKDKKSGMKISPVILILGGVVFFIVYALIWVKVFNLQLPFLPQ